MMKTINEYFDEQAILHDELFIQKMGLSEFYDAVEHEINQCIHKDKILVLGCGSGLEIERIKHPSYVVGVDISHKMLDVLKQKKLFEGLQLTTVCASILDLDFGENEYDIVLSCYTMHHFNAEQKMELYRKIHRCLKDHGVFIHGDSMAADSDEEELLRQEAEEVYKKENMPFASLHVDAPLCWQHEKEILASCSFAEICLIKAWTKTKLYRCLK